MSERFALRDVTKKFGKSVALDSVSLAARGKSIIGLVGKNGSGKTTLLRHLTGLYLPTTGICETFGVPADRLGASEMARIGAVQQNDVFLDWMRVDQLLGYISHFYQRWDKTLESHLLATLELSRNQKVGALSPGNRQKLALILATCHHPELLLLDEPLSDLDPIARQDVLTSLLDQFRNQDMTIVISSHMLVELERIADRIVYLDAGRVIVDAGLDDLKDQYAEWIVSSIDHQLPETFAEDYVLSFEGTQSRARMFVSDASQRGKFAARHGVHIESRHVNLERIFGLIAGNEKARAAARKLVAAGDQH